MTLSQDWGADLQALQAIIDAVETAREAAYTARDALAADLVKAGFTLRETAALLGISHQRVSQLTRKDWGQAPVYTPAERLRIAREAFQAARHAQKLREERYSNGWKAERAVFYGDKDTPVCDEQENRVRWAGFYEAAS